MGLLNLNRTEKEQIQSAGIVGLFEANRGASFSSRVFFFNGFRVASKMNMDDGDTQFAALINTMFFEVENIFK